MVKLWNPQITATDKILIPPVSLCDEIKTSGFDMAMIEMLCLSGFLLEETSKSGHKKWFLAADCNTRTMLLFVDGLLLNCFRHLLKKLTKLPIFFYQHLSKVLFSNRDCNVL